MNIETLFSTSIQGGLLALVVWALVLLMPSMPPAAKVWLWRLVFLKFALGFVGFANVPMHVLPAAQPSVAQTYTMEPAVIDTSAQMVAEIEPPAPSHPQSPWVGLWLAGVIALFLYTAFNVGRTVLMIRRARPVTDLWVREELEDLLRKETRPMRPRLLQSDEVRSALLAWGLRPAIVLPSGFITVGEQARGDIRLMLAHEVAHLANRDLVWNVFAAMVKGVFFFHPMVWLSASRAHLAQESAADQRAVLMTGASLKLYGDMLLRATVAGEKLRAMPGVVAVAGSVRSLRERLDAMGRFAERPPLALRWAAFASIVALLPCYSLVARAQEPQEPAAPQVVIQQAPPVARTRPAQVIVKPKKGRAVRKGQVVTTDSGWVLLKQSKGKGKKGSGWIAVPPNRVRNAQDWIVLPPGTLKDSKDWILIPRSAVKDSGPWIVTTPPAAPRNWVVDPSAPTPPAYWRVLPKSSTAPPQWITTPSPAKQGVAPVPPPAKVFGTPPPAVYFWDSKSKKYIVADPSRSPFAPSVPQEQALPWRATSKGPASPWSRGRTKVADPAQPGQVSPWAAPAPKSASPRPTPGTAAPQPAQPGKGGQPETPRLAEGAILAPVVLDNPKSGAPLFTPVPDSAPQRSLVVTQREESKPIFVTAAIPSQSVTQRVVMTTTAGGGVLYELRTVTVQGNQTPVTFTAARPAARIVDDRLAEPLRNQPQVVTVRAEPQTAPGPNVRQVTFTEPANVKIVAPKIEVQYRLTSPAKPVTVQVRNRVVKTPKTRTNVRVKKRPKSTTNHRATK